MDALFIFKIPAAIYSPTQHPCSTIDPEGLNFRVRDGNGCDRLGLARVKPYPIGSKYIYWHSSETQPKSGFLVLRQHLRL